MDVQRRNTKGLKLLPVYTKSAMSSLDVLQHESGKQHDQGIADADTDRYRSRHR
jgi:hypothetical protein